MSSPNISPRNLLLSPIWLISKVKFKPSKSKAVKVPATEFNPPIIFPEPSCSKSILAVAPDWSTYISLSAPYAVNAVSITIRLINFNLFIFPIPSFYSYFY